MENQKISGAEILIKALIDEGVDTIFGYPGGQIMPVYDKFIDYEDKIHHILVRHEQGAVHAAQGYARAKNSVGVVTVTSGPGATNVITGVADAMIDSTPVVVITGQVGNAFLGKDAFQETDVIGLTAPICKWNYQIRNTEDIAWAISKAFYIAKTGRPGPVVLDLTKDAQVGMAEYKQCKCDFIRSYIPFPKISISDIEKAAQMINEAKKPLIVFGQGIILAGAEKEFQSFLNKTNIPSASTLLGLSAIPSDTKNYIGMVGMHGNIAPNILTNECDLLIGIGMRFDDRVTGKTSQYAQNAKIIHIDIDQSEVGKTINPELGVIGNAKEILPILESLVTGGKEYKEWLELAEKCQKIEYKEVIKEEIHSTNEAIQMGEVVDCVREACGEDAIIVTDVGQNQMLSARYSRFKNTRSMITSGGLGTMGFGLPAAIGAKIAKPGRTVCLFVGDGGIQMTLQELGTIMQEDCGVKIILLNNNWLGNVRMWQELFFNKKYSNTKMLNPDYGLIAKAYGIQYKEVRNREDLKSAIAQMLSDDKAFFLNAEVMEMGSIFPMVPPGKCVNEIMLNKEDWFDYKLLKNC